MDPLAELPELMFEVADLLNLRAATEAGLAELPAAELEVLRLVSLFPGCGVAFLTERTNTFQANVSAVLRSLTARGLVVKQPDERDGRAVRLFASAQADRDLGALRLVWRQRLADACEAAGLGEDERAALEASLAKIRPYLSR